MGDAPQDGQVVRGVALAEAAFVLPEGHIQDPVQGVFHPQGPRPVPADGGQLEMK